MFYRYFYSFCVCIIFTCPVLAFHSDSLQVEVIDENGQVFPLYATGSQTTATNRRAYLEAVHGKNYAIRVHNNSARRVGLVIAVDGRNIISGQKSDLLRSERMYILDPWQTASYRGWRTSNSHINQFYFTSAEDSYAGAWKDHTAMGVIAVAVFDERKMNYAHEKQQVPGAFKRRDVPLRAESAGDHAPAGRLMEESKKEAGTGFGDERYSYARVVHFEPELRAKLKYFYKYEWREKLCHLGVISCRKTPVNRFWPEQHPQLGYVPYPPAHQVLP